MTLFNKLFSKKEYPNEPQQSSPADDFKACKTEQQLIERYGGIALDKQIDFGEVIGSNNWNADMTKGELSFGSDLVFPIQVLGTFSHGTQTWLWAWANTQSGLSQNILQHALALKKYGEDNEIDLLKNSEFDFSQAELHLIGSIASGMFDASGYYLADYGQGIMLVTIKSDKIDQLHQENHSRILTTFPQLISLFEMNHREALKHYLAAKGYEIKNDANSITAVKNRQKISAEFDELSRLSKLNG